MKCRETIPDTVLKRSKSILFGLQKISLVRTHTEELRVLECSLKWLSTLSYRCTLKPRSSSGWVPTVIKMLSFKSTISQLSNAVSTIPLWFLDTKIYCYKFWVFFHENFMHHYSKIIAEKINEILEFRNSITFDLFIVWTLSTRHMKA